MVLDLGAPTMDLEAETMDFGNIARMAMLLAESVGGSQKGINNQKQSKTKNQKELK